MSATLLHRSSRPEGPRTLRLRLPAAVGVFALAALGMLSPLQAAPLRLDIDGLPAAEYAEVGAVEDQTVQFVSVDRAADLEEAAPDLVVSNELRAPDLNAELPLLAVAPSVHADWLATARFTPDELAADPATAGVAPGLGRFSPAADAAASAAGDDRDRVGLAAPPTAAAEAEVDVERLHVERSTIQWVVVPLVLLALVLAWYGGGSRRKSHGSGGRGRSRRRRSSRASAA